jgi:hypothetical protein
MPKFCAHGNGRISMIVWGCCTGLAESGIIPPMKYQEIIADKLSAAGWSWGYCSAVTRDGWRWVVDAHKDGQRYIVHSDELLTAFLELEATLLCSVFSIRRVGFCLTIGSQLFQKAP